MIVTLLVAVALLSSAITASPAAAQPAETPRTGGVLKAAMIGEPPSLDLHWTTAVITQQISWHVFEGLYTYDRSFVPIPMLAEGHTTSDGGRRYTITLRKGVRFHNGKEMTSADVVPSLARWGKIATLGKAVWKNVESVEAKDRHTVVLHLKEPSGSLLFGLGRPNNGAAIYPREVAEAAGDAQIKDVIGTGPYRFVEHRPDRHIKLARFKAYRARAEAPEGYGGKRTAYADEILFIPVPDVAVRLAGVETGEYHFAQQIKPDQYDRIKGLATLDARIVKPYGWITAVPNHKEGRPHGAVEARAAELPVAGDRAGARSCSRPPSSARPRSPSSAWACRPRCRRGATCSPRGGSISSRRRGSRCFPARRSWRVFLASTCSVMGSATCSTPSSAGPRGPR
jgi:peptide/nickel transport system substrate-binding protein